MVLFWTGLVMISPSFLCMQCFSMDFLVSLLFIVICLTGLQLWVSRSSQRQKDGQQSLCSDFGQWFFICFGLLYVLNPYLSSCWITIFFYSRNFILIKCVLLYQREDGHPSQTTQFQESTTVATCSSRSMEPDIDRDSLACIVKVCWWHLSFQCGIVLRF